MTQVLNNEQRRAGLAAQAHSACYVCGDANPAGLALHYAADGEGTVWAEFVCQRYHEGYGGIIHGGIVAAILDGAMTNCLFATGRTGLTADLHVRLRQPLKAGSPAVVRAWIERDQSPLVIIAAEITQNGAVKARATGKFLERRAGEQREPH